MALGLLFLLEKPVFTAALERSTLKLTPGNLSLNVFLFWVSPESCCKANTCSAFGWICFKPNHDRRISMQTIFLTAAKIQFYFRGPTL